ncbi:MAG: hypothetical protein KDH15_07210 [Rhodocyclaceae bacterium]|nr:hypothetical protein [Rhodocyclaceae bacterium]
MHKNFRSVFAATAFVSTMTMAGAALAQTCTPVDFVPFTISSPGEYCLTQDLSWTGTGPAISVEADNVTVDLQGYEMQGPHYGHVPANPVSLAILADDVYNTTIRNGRISGFATGVSLRSGLPLTGGHIVENLNFNSIASAAISIGTRSTIVRNNRITRLDGNLQANCVCTRAVHGITGGNVWGARTGNEILNNSITGYIGANDATGNSYAMAFGRSSSMRISGNYIQTDALSTKVRGIQLAFSSNVFITNNTFDRPNPAIEYVSGSTGKYSGNFSEQSGSNPYVGGTPVGDNF